MENKPPRVPNWTHHRKEGPITFEAPYFQDLVRGANPNGRLPRNEIGAHALWHYFMVASREYARTKANLVYEDERSVSWNPRAIFEGIAVQHGVTPAQMSKYWDVIHQQRIALGLSSNADLPVQFQFRE